jgi:hypothetical protein
MTDLIQILVAKTVLLLAGNTIKVTIYLHVTDFWN